MCQLAIVSFHCLFFFFLSLCCVSSSINLQLSISPSLGIYFSVYRSLFIALSAYLAGFLAAVSASQSINDPNTWPP